MPESAHAQRHLLGSDRPALPAAADWLIDVLGGAAIDLGDALVVVPGGRAQRRLMELLAERSDGQALLPPRIVTIGGLAECLLADAGAVAGGLDRLLAWSSVLREAQPQLLSQVVPRPPGRDDWRGWWSLASQVVQASDELGAHLLSLQDVAEQVLQDTSHARWQALGELDRRYQSLLDERGLADPNTARRSAIASGSCRHDGPVVLIACADLQPVHRAMLSCLTTPVHALVFADAQDAEGFDDFGGLIDAYWADKPLGIEDGALRFVEGPAEQASAALDTIADWSKAQQTSADQITVGLGDASLDGPVRRAIESAGLPARSAIAQGIGQSRPLLLLRALGEFAEDLRFDRLAALARHPDAEAYLTTAAGTSPRPWLTLLDRYATDHLAARPAGGWLGDEQQVEALDAVYQAALSLLPGPVQALRPLHEWAQAMGEALSRVYGGRRLARYAEQDRPVVTALEVIGGELAQLEAIEPAAAPHCSFAQAVSLVVMRLAGKAIPEPGGEPAIELVGYLELLLDDAPRLVVTGLNEQHVPEPPRTSALLPEGVRRSVDLPDDTHRLVRDGYALRMMLASRQAGDTVLVAARRTLDGDPLLPSRLLLQADDDTLARRVLRFAGGQDPTPRSVPTVLTPGRHDRFLIPKPLAPDKPIDRLSVTAFRDYLACPYRFYLKHVLRLQTQSDQSLELSPGGFGTLAHRALQTLANPGMRSVDDVEQISERLSMAMDRAFRSAYGSDPPIAAQVQAEQLRYRLQSFAPHQARLIQEGWRTIDHERKLTAEVMVDGLPFTISGQVDRIDQHADGRHRLIDYKTSDKANKPDKAHRKKVDGDKAWVDLQLPLYLDLSAKLGVDRSAELGYINLPKKRVESGYEPAEWSAEDLESARETRDYVIRQVRAGVFWPPLLPPVYDDGLAGVCADAAPDRGALVQRSAAEQIGAGDD